jgi:integrase
MSSIYKRKKDNMWVCSVDLPKKSGSKRRRKNLYADGNLTKDKAEKSFKPKRLELEYQIENDLYRNPGNATIRDLMHEYNEHPQEIAETTKALHKMYEEKHIAPDIGGIGHIKLKDALPTIFEDFYYNKIHVTDRLSPNTVIKLHSFLHAAFKFAVKNNMLLINPLDTTKCPKEIKYKAKIPTDSQFDSLLEISRGTIDEVCIALAGVLSLCRGEIFGLKWSDVNWNNKQITIEETYVHWDKNLRKSPKAEARKRTMYAPQFVLDILWSYKKSLKEIGKYVCEEYLPDAYGKHFKKLAEKYGLSGITLHKLRHYNATLMKNLKIPDKDAAGRTGHAQLATLQEVYQHATDEADKDACDKIANHFASRHAKV